MTRPTGDPRPPADDEAAVIHPLADCGSDRIGARTRVWQFVVVLPGARIGADCNICSHVLIEGRAVVGDRVTVKSGVQLWNGVTLEDDVFVGPNASFSNDRHPRSGHRGFHEEATVVERGASIGAGAVLLPGVRVGAGAMVGAGAVVTKDVPAGATVVGNPARAVASATPPGGSAGEP
jgi:acetyltransferase-like isoleucine patch superfamily enzyme